MTFIGQTRIKTTETSIEVEWDAPYRGEAPGQYIVRLRNVDGKVIKNSKKVINGSDERKVIYEDLESLGTYKIQLRARSGNQKGYWSSFTVILGSDVPSLPDNHYMYQIPAGEDTPEDAIGSETRHVRLENGRWVRFDPAREYASNKLWWYHNELDKAEESVAPAKAKLDEWNEQYPDGPEHPLFTHKYQMAIEAVASVKQQLSDAQAEVNEEIARLYPPESFTKDQVRWVERPKRYAK